MFGVPCKADVTALPVKAPAARPFYSMTDCWNWK